MIYLFKIIIKVQFNTLKMTIFLHPRPKHVSTILWLFQICEHLTLRDAVERGDVTGQNHSGVGTVNTGSVSMV